MLVRANHDYEQTIKARAPWRWLLGLWLALFQTTPSHVAACILLYISSQGLLLIALLLPWKVLIVLNSQTFPRTLPAFLMRYETRELVVILCVSALAAFMLHLLCEVGIGYVCGRGARSVLDRHQKTGLFNSHRQQAVLLYRRLLRSLAATVCCAVIALWLLSGYPFLLFALASYLCLGLAIVCFWRALAVPPKYRVASELLGKAWWGGGFLYMVGWVIADYWRGALPGLTTAFVSLLLIRQILVFLTQVFQNLTVLEDQRGKIDALFLPETPWLPRAHSPDGFQNMLDPVKRELWVRDLLSTYAGRAVERLEIHCRTAEAGRVIYMTTCCTVDDTESAYLLKLYHQSHETFAQHEREILQIAPCSWPAPRLLGDHLIEQHTCLVFEWNAAKRWLEMPERTSALLSLRERLLTCVLPEALMARYDRSHPRLSHRLLNVDWALLASLTSSVPARERCDTLRAHWPSLMDELDRLPRQLVLSGLKGRMMGAEGAELPTICNWTRWRWEPVGAGWPKESSPEQLQNVLQCARHTRNDLHNIDAEHAHRAALLFEFEQCLSGGNFTAALSLIDPICKSAGLLSTREHITTAVHPTPKYA
ncbi:hypothetical protein [Phyllobacterium phragmitis]|uniref:Uncharacterized protein n=1 Tax=Phyllobacterium phragmitis TaxID=2670329 RepID=A0ABQ0H5P2_9HYPH